MIGGRKQFATIVRSKVSFKINDFLQFAASNMSDLCQRKSNILTMARIRSFATPHKGLRNVISKFSLRLGYTEFNNPTAIQALKELGDEMFKLLNDHVHTENDHTLRHLEERMPGASAHDRHDHEKLDAIQNELQMQVRKLTGKEPADEIHGLYLKFALFQSEYLEHINEEETVTEILLQKYFTDEELIQHRTEIMQKLEPNMLTLWLKYVIPAQRLGESIGMLAGLKADAPEAFFIKVMSTIKREMEQERYEELEEKLVS